jgi:hypothetical protein
MVLHIAFNCQNFYVTQEMRVYVGNRNSSCIPAVNAEADVIRGFTASAGLVKLAAEALNCRWYQTMHSLPHNKTNTCIRLFGMFNKHLFKAVNVGFTYYKILRPLLASKSWWQIRHLSTDGIRPCKTNIWHYDMFNNHPFEAVNVEADALRGCTASAGLEKLVAA